MTTRIVSGWTLAFVLVSLPLFHLARSAHAKLLVVVAANVAFVGFLASPPDMMLPMAAFLAATFALVRVVHRWRGRGALAASLTATITAFVCLKRYALPVPLPAPAMPYSVVGLSYVLFRVVHLMVDTSDGAVEPPPSLASFLGYTCFFPCWLSGPIQRYQDWTGGLSGRRRDDVSAHDALSRIVTGVFKVAIVSAALLDVHEATAGATLATAPPLRFVATLGIASAAYVLYMYYNFAGYMDVVIGLASCYGLRLPENFDRPFAARNFLEFWSRWHITLSNWFKVYLFNPSLRALAARYGTPRAMPYLGVLAYFLTFAVMGVWHGTTRGFFVYGLLLGLGVSVNKLYEIEAGRRMGKERFRALRANAWYAATCRGAVFAYFAAALVCFWATPLVVQRVVGSPAPALATFAGVTVVAAAVLAVVSGVAAAANGWRRRFTWAPATWTGGQLVLGVKLYAVLVLVLVKATALPAFVYVPF